MFTKKQIILLAIVFIVFLPVLVLASVEIKDVDKSAVMKKVSGLQIPFIENEGQIKDNSVRFYANTFAGTVFVTEKGEIVYSLIKQEDRSQNLESRTTLNSELKTPDLITKAVVVRESLECPEETRIIGLNKAETQVHYFKGTRENWKTNIPTWQEVSLGEVYKGIELKLRAYGKNVEKLFTVYPKGIVNDIKLKIEGAKRLRVNKDGELEVETEIGTVKYTKPVAYQEIDSKKVNVEVDYNILSGTVKGHDSQIYGFKIASYDHSMPLIIDPLLASTFIGGSYQDEARALAIDSFGNVFIAGHTNSTNYPSTSGAYDTTFNG